MSLYTDAKGIHPDSGNSNASVEKFVEGSITAAQMLAARATPITLVAAPDSDEVLELIGGVLIYDYAAAYTETADNLAVKFTNGSGAAASETIETTGFLDATADKVIKIEAIKDALCVPGAALVLHNTGDGELGGTGSPLRFRLKVVVHKTGL
jgi:hypothetical protein